MSRRRDALASPWRRAGIVLIALVATPVLDSAPTAGHGYKRKSIEVVHPWTSEKGEAEGRDAVVGMKLKNSAPQADRLVRAESSVAERVELRGADNAVLSAGITIPAAQSIDLKIGSVHIRLVGLRRTLIPYDTLPVELILEKAGTIAIDVMVEEALR